MSEIWGYINTDLSGKDLSREKHLGETFAALAAKAKTVNEEFDLDRIDEVTISDAYFGCGHQYITAEDVEDISPIQDESNSIIFDGDCFLYNREDVISLISDREQYISYISKLSRPLGDIELSCIAYRIFGNDFVKYLRGSFCFAIYNYKTKILDLFTDHLVKRYLAYYVGADGVYFGQTFKMIKTLADRHFDVNREYIINAYRDMSPLSFFVPNITPYEGIYHLENASHVTINCKTKEVTNRNYWNPLKNVKKIKHKSDEEYKELFLSTYKRVAIGMLRSKDETGIMLSGGLDSSSVAALVAPELAHRGQTLYSYTSVPTDDFVQSKSNMIIENESRFIEDQKKRHPNIEPRYINHNNTDVVEQTPHYQKLFSSPVKPSLNMLNIEHMSIRANQDNCRVLLGGGNGNPTVSYGEIGNYLSLELLSGHPFRAVHELLRFCERMGIPKKRYFKAWIKTMVKYAIKKPEEYTFYLKVEDREKYGLSHSSRDHQKQFGTEYLVNERQKRNFMYMPIQYIQKGFFYTELMLRYKYQMLDPTLSVEMIELALSLPNSCFCKDGLNRRMVRDYMKDLIPESILDIRKGYGVQAADFVFNVNRDWERIKEETYDILNEPLLREYLDEKELDILIKDLHENEGKLTTNPVCAAAQIASLGYFLRDNSK